MNHTSLPQPVTATTSPSGPVQAGSAGDLPYYISQCEFGLGVFAARDIVFGEVILEFTGPVIDFAETKRRGPKECMAIQIGPDRYLDTRPPGVLVNHSCNPNAGIRQDRCLVALRTIRAGQEIRYDYSTTMEEHSFTMECRCGSPVCRKVVRDFSTLPWLTQAHYISQGVVMSFILEKMRAGHARRNRRPVAKTLRIGSNGLQTAWSV